MTMGAAVPMMATMKALPPMTFTCQAGGVGGGGGGWGKGGGDGGPKVGGGWERGGTRGGV